MDASDTRDELSDRVAEAVRHALALVGPAESGGLERVSAEEREAA